MDLENSRKGNHFCPEAIAVHLLLLWEQKAEVTRGEKDQLGTPDAPSLVTSAGVVSSLVLLPLLPPAQAQATPVSAKSLRLDDSLLAVASLSGCVEDKARTTATLKG